MQSINELLAAVKNGAHGLNDSALLAETMWYFPDYQIECFLDVLLRDGKVKFLKI